MYVATRRDRMQQQQMLNGLQLMSPRMMPASMAPRPSPPVMMQSARPALISSYGRQPGMDARRAEEDRKAAILAAQPRSAHNIARDEAAGLYKTLLAQGRSSAEAIAIMAAQGKRLMTF